MPAATSHWNLPSAPVVCGLMWGEMPGSPDRTFTNCPPTLRWSVTFAPLIAAAARACSGVSPAAMR
jgi:hypothetical protein